MVTSKVILVTGGAGFIGSHLTDRFVSLGYKVIVIDNLSTGKLSNISKGVSFHHASVSEANLEEIFQRERPNIIFHYAAQTSVNHSIKDSYADAETNIMGTLRLIEAARQFGVDKFVFASTGGALYGDPDYDPCDENHPIRPLSPYGLSKSVGEQYLDLYYRSYRLKYVALRFGNVYGPRQDPRGEAGVISIFAGAMSNGIQPRIYGSGQQERDFIYVDDAVDANIKCLKDDVVGPYNIGTGVKTSINNIYQELAAILKYKQKPVFAPTRPGDVASISLDSTKAKKEMEWRSATGINEGLIRTMEYFSDQTRALV